MAYFGDLIMRAMPLPTSRNGSWEHQGLQAWTFIMHLTIDTRRRVRASRFRTTTTLFGDILTACTLCPGAGGGVNILVSLDLYLCGCWRAREAASASAFGTAADWAQIAHDGHAQSCLLSCHRGRMPQTIKNTRSAAGSSVEEIPNVRSFRTAI